MKHIIPFLILAAFVACQDGGPVGVDAEEGPAFAKCPGPGCDKGGGGGGAATVQVHLCAKQDVIEQINGTLWRPALDEPWQSLGDDIEPGDAVDSTDPVCGTDAPLAPSGTFAYTPEGPAFEWEFKGEGFPRPERGPAYGAHRYRLVYYQDPWPGSPFICLGEEGIPNGKGRLRLQGTTELNSDLSNARIWIVRRAWAYCHLGELRNNAINPGSDGPYGPWPYWPGEPYPDATYSIWGPYWNDGYGMFAYDWLFEATAEDRVNYTYTP
jgi:hypothetical protein